MVKTLMDQLAAAQIVMNDMEQEIALLRDAVSFEVSQDVHVLDAIRAATAPLYSIQAGTVAGDAGATVDYLIYFKAGTKAVAGLQFDLAFPPGMTPTTVSAGIASLAANKSAQANLAQGKYRVLIFGVNQTAIPSGPIAVVKVAIDPTAKANRAGVAVSGTVATDPNGTAVAITSKAGTFTVR